MNVSMNPNYIEDLNGSDYVCMTRSTPQSISKLAAMNPVSTNNHRASPTNSSNNNANNNNNNNSATANMPAAMQLTSKNLQTLQQEQMNASNNRSQLASSEIDKASSTSPTPSQLSNNSNKRKPRTQCAIFNLVFF